MVIKLVHLQLGARFRYTDGGELFVLLQRSGCGAIARRLLEAVPISSAWRTDAVLAEYSRLNGGLSMDRNKAAWALSTLKDAGLVREVGVNVWQRVEARQPAPPVRLVPIETDHNEGDAVSATATKPAETPVFDRLTAIADSLRKQSTIATQQGQLLSAAAEQLEELALDMETRSSSEQADAAKLRQLRDLLGKI